MNYPNVDCLGLLLQNISKVEAEQATQKVMMVLADDHGGVLPRAQFIEDSVGDILIIPSEFGLDMRCWDTSFLQRATRRIKIMFGAPLDNLFVLNRLFFC